MKQDDKPNAATIAWGSICCSQPPCLAVSLRSATYTHGSIMGSKAFTVNVPAQTQASLVDYFGLASGRNVDKFAVTGLTAVRSSLVNAPYIAEFPLILECALLQVVEIGLHTQFVGEIKDAKVDPVILDSEGNLDMAKMGAVIFSPQTHMYYGLGEILGQTFAMGKVHVR